MSNLSNETIQQWIAEAKASGSRSAYYRLRELGTALIEARRDLADIAKGLQDVGTSLDELKELL